MYLYIILIFFIGWFSHSILKWKYSEKLANLIFLSLMLLVCLFAMGFRDTSVGVDTVSYKQFFDDYVHYDWNKILTEKPTGNGDTVELGLKILMKLCADIYPNYYFYQFIFSSIYLLLIFNFIYKHTSNVVLAFAIFLGGGLYMQTFNIARQMLAIAFTAYSMTYILDRKFIKALLLIWIAYLFHSSSVLALIMFVVYFISKNKYILMLTPLLLVIAVLSIENFLLPLLLNLFGDKYLGYAISDYSRPNKGILLKLIWLFNLIISVISLLYFKEKSSLQFFGILSLGAVACYWIGLSINYADRVGLMFLPAIMLMYDKVGSNINNKTIRFLFINGFTLFYISYFYYYIQTIESIKYDCIV